MDFYPFILMLCIFILQLSSFGFLSKIIFVGDFLPILEIQSHLKEEVLSDQVEGVRHRHRLAQPHN